MADRGFDPDRLLQVLHAHGVQFVLIGGYAAALHGSDHLTFDVDITPSRDPVNLDRLSSALTELGARIRVEGIEGGLPFAHDGRSLAKATVWNLVTDAGDLDLAFLPAGTEGWEDLHRSGIVVDLPGGRTEVAALADIVRSKEAADRPKDHLVLPVLRRLLRRSEGS